ncbi:hypothetical protein EJ06DRAFT_349782 [Trichodelitschia bisporula]|uniref:Uncharacterized protein n=1 Tax=Trichodelitschia bisporula TaxID=703511 RepID=A0A6G1I067_9PEZI|nr:hypothetical protein EJ06DRAFT_349782 [Trichodelitschia bisporula]
MHLHYAIYGCMYQYSRYLRFFSALSIFSRHRSSRIRAFSVQSLVQAIPKQSQRQATSSQILPIISHHDVRLVTAQEDRHSRLKSMLKLATMECEGRVSHSTAAYRRRTIVRNRIVVQASLRKTMIQHASEVKRESHHAYVAYRHSLPSSPPTRH